MNRQYQHLLGIAAALALTLTLAIASAAEKKTKLEFMANVSSSDGTFDSFSPDGKQLLMAGTGRLWLWDVENGRLIRSFRAKVVQKRSRTVSTATNAKAGLVASANKYSLVTVWRAGTGEILRSFDEAGLRVAFSLDGKHLITGEDSIKIWDVETWKLLRTLKVPGTVSEFSPDRKYAALRSEEDGKIALVQMGTGKVVHLLDANAKLFKSAFSADGKLLAAVPEDSGESNSPPEKPIRIWDIDTGKETHRFRNTSSPSSIVFSHKNRQLASIGEDGVVRRWDLETGSEIGAVKLNGKTGCCPLLSPDAAFVVSEDERVTKVWDSQSGQVVRTLGLELESIASLGRSRDGKKLLTASPSSTAGVPYKIREWNLETGQLQRTWGIKGALALKTVVFSTGGQLAASGGDGDEDKEKEKDGTPRPTNALTIWTVATGEPLRVLTRDTARLAGLGFSPDAARIVSADETGDLVMWDIATGDVLWRSTLPDGARSLTAPSFSAAGDRLLVGGWRGDVMGTWIVDAAAGKPLQFYREKDNGYHMSSVLFTPDGRRMFAADGDWSNNISLWDVKSGAKLRVLKGHNDAVETIAVSPDGKFLLSGSNDGTARLWDSATGKQIRLLNSDSSSAFNAVAFSADGNRAFTAQDDGSLKVWNVSDGALRLPVFLQRRRVAAARFPSFGG